MIDVHLPTVDGRELALDSKTRISLSAGPSLTAPAAARPMFAAGT
jgi:hypothetical protein